MLGSFNSGVQDVQCFYVTDDEWDNTVLPAINDINVPGVDDMNILWYWTPATGSGELPYYLIEKTDRTGQFPNNYNHTPDTGGPVTANITAIVDALYPLFEAKRDEWIAQQAEAAAAAAAQAAYVETMVPANMTTLRADRDIRLTNCDWTQLPDCQLSDEEKAKWATYRQRLRDFPSTFSDPYSPADWTDWPVTPESSSFVP